MFSFCNSGAKVMKKNEKPTFTAKKSKVFCFPCILKVCLGVKTYCLTQLSHPSKTTNFTNYTNYHADNKSFH